MKSLDTYTTTTPYTQKEILHDYYICCLSREISIYIRKDVLTGRAKFGVSDDGKELFQVALAKAFKKGDWRADYYRGITLLLALNISKPEDILAQLYADPKNDPFSAGRQMGGHHNTPIVDQQGNWFSQNNTYNIASDISTTAGQMGRGFGLAFASKVYREADHLASTGFSNQGNEVCFCNIGDASTSEGAFWESLNAAAVVQCPLAITVVDDGYGISVPKAYQTTKGSISEAAQGFQAETGTNGVDIHYAKGWDYPELCEVYKKGIASTRETQRPALFHIDELTQPQGHSTSGSHERYKSKKRLAWEKEYDCNRQFKLWMLATGVAEEAELEEIEKRAKKEASAARQRAWSNHYSQIARQQQKLTAVIEELPAETSDDKSAFLKDLAALTTTSHSEMLAMARKLRFKKRDLSLPTLDKYISNEKAALEQLYKTHLYSETPKAAILAKAIPAIYSEDSKELNGFEILNHFFDRIFEKIPNVYAFGEDVGKIGGVNQGFAGLQKKHGEHRIFDTGIREWTIIGQAIGMAMRGLRPIAEIQYLDYLIYALSPLSDDLATLRWRTAGTQCAPAIIRTRGHRLEGIWHSGSPMSLLLGSLNGMHICVPRNMVQAIGMYNTLLHSDDPALVVECLNGYRLKETLPDNYDSFKLPLGVPEIMRSGNDVTLVTYGACVRIAEAAAEILAKADIDVEIIDVQTLLPFDLEHRIIESLQKTNRLVVLDEDIPGGASAYILRNILEEQDGYFQLDAQPLCITGTAHRPPYGDDGNYISKPNVEDVVEQIYDLARS